MKSLGCRYTLRSYRWRFESRDVTSQKRENQQNTRRVLFWAFDSYATQAAVVSERQLGKRLHIILQIEVQGCGFEGHNTARWVHLMFVMVESHFFVIPEGIDGTLSRFWWTQLCSVG